MNDLKEFQSFAKRNKKIIAKNNKAVIYTRVSGAKQVENTSLETQKKECTQYALNNNLEIYGYFGGTHESAKNDERKENKRMLAYVKQNKIAIGHHLGVAKIELRRSLLICLSVR